MAKVRVLVYRDESDEVLEDFLVEDPDLSSYRVAMAVKAAIPEHMYVGDTLEEK